MRFAERFLIVFAAIGLGARIFGAATAPVFLLLGFPALALYYIGIFPFLKRRAEGGSRAMAAQIATGAGLAYCITGFLLYTLGWIDRTDVLSNCCALLALLGIAHLVAYYRLKNLFSLEALVRATVLLTIVLIVALALLPFVIVR